MGLEDMAEDLNARAVTYRIQDACANCRHVFVRQEYDNDDELYCTFAASERPPCMSVYMDEFKLELMQPWGVDDEGHKKWEAWKNGRRVLPQAICGEWAPRLDAKITQTPSGFLAILSDGRQIEAVDIRDLASAVHEAGVHVDDAHCADWREGDVSPGAGSAIAFKAEMRKK